jgi:hypothetical protein
MLRFWFGCRPDPFKKPPSDYLHLLGVRILRTDKLLENCAVGLSEAFWIVEAAASNHGSKGNHMNHVRYFRYGAHSWFYLAHCGEYRCGIETQYIRTDPSRQSVCEFLVRWQQFLLYYRQLKDRRRDAIFQFYVVKNTVYVLHKSALKPTGPRFCSQRTDQMPEYLSTALKDHGSA